MTESQRDVIVIGGGIIGLAAALEITVRFPRLRLLVLEKERRVGQHQSGHNSGVIHSGVYYRPGSLKAKLCVEGARAMIQFCREHGIAHQVCGKVIVATSDAELPRLEELRQRGEANGIDGLRFLVPEELHDIEPYANGIRALAVPSTGITDYAKVCDKFAELIVARGEITLSTKVTGLKRNPQEVIVQTDRGEFVAKAIINCAGLFSDRIAKMAGDKPDLAIFPFAANITI